MEAWQGKVIAVTGAASGIGLAVAQLLASRGVHLSLADVHEEPLLVAAEKIAAGGGKVITHVVDIRNQAQVEAWLETTIETLGHLDGAANMAGVSPRKPSPNGIVDQDDEDWKFVLGINLDGTMNCLRSQMRHMVPGGSIVNASSVMGLEGRRGSGAYVASKHGVLGISRCVAKEGAPKGIRVNCIAPGFIDTPMLSSAPLATSQLGSQVPLGRIGLPREVAYLVAFLLGDESKYITGTVIPIDGGWHG